MPFFIVDKFIFFTLKTDSFETRNEIDKIRLLILGETR
ncbi:hypothetical protein NEOCIP111885_03536 [Pseudoneobacillus rhizosphaerae]|uniref:Uncharacterized protein n=1 Tax=Pseudoneobacillus rhizosphaerae TaxID=2880968 RepID=A0A9C7GCI3_9BACI|nr:hypothetical protein NEOCIP111885_03536 [Pseudoneobacillus rhizosphaerae]